LVQVDLSGIGGLSDLTEVKNEFDWVLSNGYIQIDFDENFCYNGSDNLLLIWENRDGSWQSGYRYSKCWSDNTYHESWYKYQDNSYPTGLGDRALSYRPNFKLLY
jgi:hypothetical protein